MDLLLCCCLSVVKAPETEAAIAELLSVVVLLLLPIPLLWFSSCGDLIQGTEQTKKLHTGVVR